MQVPTDTKPRWERRKDARPQELLAAALDLFVERGFASTRLEDVAKRAGVSKGTLYLYFENKEELFKAVVRANIVHVIGEAENSFAASDSNSADLLACILMQWWQQVGATKLAGLTKLMMAEAGNFPELTQFYNEEVIARGNALIASMLERGIARGEFRPVDPQLTTAILIAPVIMLTMWANSFLPCDMADIDADAYMRAFIDMSLRGLAPDRPAGSPAP
ncbi:TetR/AcrR family transcriptional regulator [Janthinobacterium agaricidamnosum]|uniref:Bacterial regulatory s, tetR family protein n=1 Tax=Janthinobacterium agaricidamnosum NBRC 102515 = DSM 9628 TaxID=1349767 RepID=W0V0J4_9BURK|nr:TetR/AcrR family transcriptional regulator [Janthinobacterium agaricidamnosum]CDG81115.1 bacterial regulatory s, tetR family protein [Janthinobacterium agaricidamnosum NBRC 102515 = DSM 9628]